MVSGADLMGTPIGPVVVVGEPGEAVMVGAVLWRILSAAEGPVHVVRVLECKTHECRSAQVMEHLVPARGTVVFDSEFRVDPVLEQVNLYCPVFLRTEETLHVSQELVGFCEVHDNPAVAFLVVGPDDRLGPTAQHGERLDVHREQLQDSGSVLGVGPLCAQGMQESQLLGRACQPL